MMGRPRDAGAVWTAIAVAALATLATLAAGCIHRLEPGAPLTLFAEVDFVFPPGTRVAVENGYEAPAIERLRTEGIHHLEVDYRRWTERLVLDLREDLDRRNAGASVSASANAGASAPGAGPAPRLIVWVTAIRPPTPLEEPGMPGEDPGMPREDRGALLEARVQSAQGAFVAWHRIAGGLKGFADAYALLRRRILDDERFREWLLRQEIDS